MNLGEILIERGIITEDDVNSCLEMQMAGKNMKTGEILIERGLCTPLQVLEALGEQFGMEIIPDLENIVVPKTVLNLVSFEDCRLSHIFPVDVVDNVLRVATSDPFDLTPLDTLTFSTSLLVQPVLALRESIESCIKRHYDPLGDEMEKMSKRAGGDGSEIQIPQTEEEGPDTDEDGSVTKLLTLIIMQAVQARASDIHIEPGKRWVRVRVRIDGNLHEIDSIPLKLRNPITSRIKSLAKLDLAERRKPQDGKIILKRGKRNLDLRVSFIPSQHGESVVMRILDQSSVKFGLEYLGMDNSDMKEFKRVINRPNGICLITGPTGSGKTTTLYTVLTELNRSDRKIMTIENPVEYRLSGIHQSEVWMGKDGKGLTFESALRAMLRQAPNIILVGEIRDKETAHVAITAALTGHLVFSTLHTNDAPSAITRLTNMGISPSTIASSVRAVMAQRLVRKLCDCKVPDMELRGGGKGQFNRPQGCKICRDTGYHGRTGIYELMIMQKELRELCEKKATTDELRNCAVRSCGMHTLYQDGMRKVELGVTTKEEIALEAVLS